MVQFDEDKQLKKVEDLRAQEEENLAQMLSEKYGVEYIDLSRVPINSDALRLLSEGESRAAKLAIFDAAGKRLRVAVQSPQNEKTQNTLKELADKGFSPETYMVSSASLERAWGRYGELSYAAESKAGMLDISNEEIQDFSTKLKTMVDIQAAIHEALSIKKTYRISRLLEIMVAGALSVDASDVHLEPEEETVRLRYRLDGVLTDVLKFDRETFTLLLSRIKLLSGLKLNLKEAPQDGRLSIHVNNMEIEIRSSVIPGSFGEAVVLRILNPNTISVPMEELGIEPALYALLEKEIKKPNGMLLNTGPTGSGKTTTLYAFLKKIHTPEVKIITIEDPVEYHLSGIVQTQVNHKDYTFAEGLRSALRQDPDVIMVGEIRDGETAEIAINAGLTGHLVFSTLHTNNAAGAFPRLIDLGVNSRVISSAVNAVIAQRLVRRLCDKCRTQVEVPEQYKPLITRVLESTGVSLPSNQVWHATGCEACNSLGYKGRLGIFEAILMTPAIDEIVSGSPSEHEIAQAAKAQGIPTMLEDGVLKVLRSVTTFEELGRVVDLGI